MANNFQILNEKKYFKRQFQWIERQIKSFKDDSFVDFDLAVTEFEKGNITIYSSHKILLAFVEEFLSDTGKKRLNTALKVAKKRDEDRKNSKRKLEVVLDLNTYVQLDELAKRAGITKIEALTQLINREAEQTDLWSQPEREEDK